MTQRRVGWLACVGVLIAWLVAGLLGAFIGTALTGTTDDAYAQASTLLAHVAVPSALALGVGVAAVSILRWWPVVLREPLRMPAWAWIIPAGMVIAAAFLADWGRLTSAGGALLAALVITVILIAASEELLFRGFLLTALRSHTPEWVAALVTSAVFALMHVIVAGGLTNIGQGISAFLGGYLYYVTRRVSGNIIAPIVVHAWFDLMALSVLLGPGEDTDKHAFEGVVVLGVLCIVSLPAWRSTATRHEAAAA